MSLLSGQRGQSLSAFPANAPTCARSLESQGRLQGKTMVLCRTLKLYETRGEPCKVRILTNFTTLEPPLYGYFFQHSWLQYLEK